VDGLLTGWHEPAASHLLMLEAVAGRQLLVDSYAAALAGGYRWHEFGGLRLILPRRPNGPDRSPNCRGSLPPWAAW
jgi:S-adenosylmethionine:tRNA ribosyltransferase-isomerase